MTTFNIQDFCADRDDIRPYLLRPFAYDGKLYASNGHIAVCVPSDEPNTEYSIGERIEKLFETVNFDAGMEPLPVYHTVVLQPCEDCGGSGKGKALKECRECRGEGFVEWDNDFNTYEADCKGCNGDGEVGVGEEVPCKPCNGTGSKLDVPVAFGQTFINYRYLALMETLPSLLVGLEGNVFPAVIPFKFDGGIGLVMPISPKINP